MTSEKRGQKFHTDDVSVNPDLVGASDWSCRVGNLLQLIRSAIQIWIVTRHRSEFLCSSLRRHFTEKTVVASRNDGCFQARFYILQISVNMAGTISTAFVT